MNKSLTFYSPSYCSDSSNIHDQSSLIPRNRTMDLVSVESFLALEKKCEEEEENDLLAGVDVPNLNDTLEEVDFILSFGNKLKEEGKIYFVTPPTALIKPKPIPKSEPKPTEQTKRKLNVTFSSPLPAPFRSQLSAFSSPVTSRWCRSNMRVSFLNISFLIANNRVSYFSRTSRAQLFRSTLASSSKIITFYHSFTVSRYPLHRELFHCW